MKFPEIKPFAGNKQLAIELLKKAKEPLIAQERRFLCNAVSKVVVDEFYPQEKTGKYDIKDVDATLEAVCDWLNSMCTNKGAGSSCVNKTDEFIAYAASKDIRPDVAQITQTGIIYRLAWVDHLVDYLKEQQ